MDEIKELGSGIWSLITGGADHMQAAMVMAAPVAAKGLQSRVVEAVLVACLCSAAVAFGGKLFVIPMLEYKFDQAMLAIQENTQDRIASLPDRFTDSDFRDFDEHRFKPLRDQVIRNSYDIETLQDDIGGQ